MTPSSTSLDGPGQARQAGLPTLRTPRDWASRRSRFRMDQ
jgi:hypothetical protein